MPPETPIIPAASPALPPDLDEQAIWRSIFAAYPDSLLLVDQAGRIVFANPSASAMLGYPIEELMALNVDDLVPDSIRPRHAAFRESYAGQPRSRPMGTQMDLVAKRKDGSEVMVEIALSPLRGLGVPFVIAAIRDVGTYPRVRQALQRARYSEHLAQMGRTAVNERDPHVLLDHACELAVEALQVEMAQVFLLESNRLEFRLAGKAGQPACPVGDRLPNRPDALHGFVLSKACPVVVDDVHIEQRFALPHAEVEAGLRSALAVPISDQGRVIGLLCVASAQPGRFADDETRFLEALSSLLATSLQRAQTEEALKHAQRLESVGQLTGGIAHDFNNLLTVIQGNLQVLEDLPALAGNPHVQQLVGAAARAARRGADLTGKLLAFSRRQVLQQTQVDANALLISLSDMLRRTLDQRIRIHFDPPPDSPQLLADPGQLESALLNIAINARDAMPEGGLLRFECTVCETAPCLHRAQGVSDGPFVAISISDTGCGMTEEVRKRAFEPFFTTKDLGRGTGLGLSTVYGFVKQSKGSITVDSVAGVGTTVTLYLPRHGRGPAPEEALARADEWVPPGLKVLLVEDDVEVRKVVQMFLGTLGCQVHTTRSGEEALLSLAPQENPAFDLLLTDIALGPGLRGTQLAMEAQRRFPKLGILLMSGYSSELLDAERDFPPAWELLRKPYGRAELAQAIMRVLAPPQEDRLG